MQATYANPNIDFKQPNYKRFGAHLRKEKIKPADISANLIHATSVSRKSAYNYTRGLIHTQKTREQFVQEGKELFDASVTLPSAKRKRILSAVVDETGRAGSLFLIQNISGLRQPEARAVMKDLLDSGGQVSDVALWLQAAGHVLRKHNIKASDTAEVVVDAVGDALEWVVDAVEDGIDAILEGIDAIIDAVTDAGAAIVDLFVEVVEWTAEQIGNLLAALIEAGRELIEFVGATFRWAYDAVTNFVRAAFEVGLTIADLLATVVSETYWTLRRFVNGILENLGPIGEILDFILTQVEDATDELWRRTLLAIRFAEGRLTEALDWVADQTDMAFEAIVNAWESIGETLLSLYEWAVEAGAAAWQAIGEATATLGNSIYYAYKFLTESAVEFIFDFTRGLIAAGEAIGGIIGWAVDQTIEICGEVIRAAIDAGQTIATMLVEIARDPGNALNTFIQGMQEIGQTLDDLFQAAFIDTAEEFLDEVVEALRELGTAIVDMLEAALRLSGAALATLIASLLNLLGSYRPLSQEERDDAETVFGNSLDYDLIFLSTEDPVNEIIFGVQDFFTNNPDSRAFVTNNLINFDVDDGEIDRPTLIHELTHVWQHREVGGIYMAEAIIAQVTNAGVGGDAYNYGYNAQEVAEVDSLDIRDHYDNRLTNYVFLGDIVGEGGEAALNAAGGDFDSFNREQQGQIMMHWFVRNQLEIFDDNDNPVISDATAWAPYQQVVFNS